MRILIGLLATILILGVPVAQATPLRVDYTVNDLGGGTYQYDFRFILDNNDGSWVSGQSWDWFIFGDRSGSANPSAFGPSITSTWTWQSTDAPFTQQYSGGGHEGPTSCYTTDGCSGIAWIPSAVGDSWSGSGTSPTLIADGDMYWSILVASNGASSIQFEIANRVPEPTTILLLGLGLAGIAFSKRRLD